MIAYKKVYIDYFDYCVQDVILCERCSNIAVDIHHLTFKSQGGKDEISNLMALCRCCHDKAHSDKEFNETLKLIHEKIVS